MFAVCGDETGLCKDVPVDGKGSPVTWGGVQSRELGVDRLCWLDSTNQERGVVAALRSGSLQHWNPAQGRDGTADDGAGAASATCVAQPRREVGTFEGRAAGLAALSRREAGAPSLVVCNEAGTVQVMEHAPGAGFVAVLHLAL